jgi:hypothetical protein
VGKLFCAIYEDRGAERAGESRPHFIFPNVALKFLLEMRLQARHHLASKKHANCTVRWRIQDHDKEIGGSYLLRYQG